jgi:hypothetical protein
MWVQMNIKKPRRTSVKKLKSFYGGRKGTGKRAGSMIKSVYG